MISDLLHDGDSKLMIRSAEKQYFCPRTLSKQYYNANAFSYRSQYKRNISTSTSRATFTNTKELLTIFNNISYISTTENLAEKRKD